MSKLKTNSVKKNLFFNIMYQALLTLTPLITTPYVSRVLGVNNIGEYSYILSIVNYFCIFGLLGSSTYGQLLISKKRDNKEECSRVFSIVLYSRMITMLIALVLYTIYIIIFKIDSKIYIILYIYFISQCVDIAWLYQGLERFDITVPCSAIAKIMSVVAIFILVKKEQDVGKYVALLNGSTLIGNLLMWVNVNKYVAFCKVGCKDILKSIKDNMTFFIPTIATIIFGSLDKCMIGWITSSTTQNGYYEQANKIYNVLVSVITALTAVMLPRMAYLWKEKNNQKAIRYYLNKTLRYVSAIVFPISFGLYVIAPEFVPVFFGLGYEDCIGLIRVFSCILIFTCFNSIISNQCMVANGKQNILNKMLVVSSLINVILNIIFIKFYQALGAAFASLASEGILLFLILSYNKKILLMKKNIGYIIKYFLFAILMSFFILLLKQFNISIGIKLILEILDGVVIYICCLVLSKDELLFEIISKVINTLKANKY